MESKSEKIVHTICVEKIRSRHKQTVYIQITVNRSTLKTEVEIWTKNNKNLLTSIS